MQHTATEHVRRALLPGTTRAFRLLMLGSTVSMLGSRITAIAYPMLVLYMKGSPFAAGVVAFAATAPSLVLSIPAGALVDRWDSRRAMLVSETGRGAAIAAVVVVWRLGLLTVPLLIALAVIEETLEVFSTLAERRYVRSLVEPGEASSALVRIEARTHVAVLVGRPLGGFFFGLAPMLPFSADALSFAFSVWTIILTGSRKALTFRPQRASNRQLRDDVINGLKWLLENRYARSAAISSAVITLIAQALIMVFIAAAHHRQLPPAVVGIALAASGAGGALGSMALRPIAARVSTMTGGISLIQVQMVACGAAYAILAAFGSQSFWYMAVVMAIVGFTGSLGNIEISTYLIQNVREDMLARITGINQQLTFGACAIGPLLGGFLIQEFGTQQAVRCLSAITVLFALYSYFSPSMRDRGTVVSAVRSEVGPHQRSRGRPGSPSGS
jgi:MFS family permease